MNDISTCSEIPVQSAPLAKVKPDVAAVHVSECIRNAEPERALLEPANPELHEQVEIDDVVQSVHSAQIKRDSACVHFGEYTWNKYHEREKYLKPRSVDISDPSLLKPTDPELPEEPQINEVPFGIRRKERKHLMALQYLPRDKSILKPIAIQYDRKGTPARSSHTGYLRARKPPKLDPGYSLWEARQPYRLTRIKKKPLDRTSLRLTGHSYQFVQTKHLARNPVKQDMRRFRISSQLPADLTDEQQFMMDVERSPSGMPRALAYYDKNNCTLYLDDWDCWLDLDVKKPVFRFEYSGPIRCATDAMRWVRRSQQQVPLRALSTLILKRNAKTWHVFQ
jgi:hypothetical protein